MLTGNDWAGLGLGSVAGLGTFFVAHYFVGDTEQSLKIALLVGVTLGTMHRSILNFVDKVNGDKFNANNTTQAGFFGMKKMTTYPSIETEAENNLRYRK